MYNAQTWRDQRERRYQPARGAARDLMSEIAARMPAVHYQDTAESLVVTTYFDTRNRHYLRRAERSNGERSLKIRIREYLWRDRSGALRFHDVCFLERKQRDGDVRLKQRIALDKSEAIPIVVGTRALRGNCQEAEAIRQELNVLQLIPAMVSAYDRRVFGDDRELRVTLDERVGFYPPPRGLYDVHSALTPDVLGPPLATGPSRILEVKQPAHRDAPAWLEQLLAALPEGRGYSKYRDGMRALDASDGQPRVLTRRLML